MTVISEKFDSLGSDGRAAKLGIMGGTFDPIHIGHLNMAAEVAEACQLDAVLFIPTGNPVFKRDQYVTDASHRLAMCRLAVAGNARFDVSSIEIDRGGDTYTIDTLRQLRAHYPKNVTFYLVTGTDAAASIHKWRGASDIAELAQLIVAVRPGFELGQDDCANMAAAGFSDPHLVEVTELAVSSSDVRTRMSEGREARYLVCPHVWKYIREYGLYGSGDAAAAVEATQAACGAQQGVASADGPLSDEFFAARLKDLESRVSPKRLAHIKGVADTCVQLARVYGVDERSAYLAGLLHDWDKGLDDAGIRARVKELGLDAVLDPAIVESMPQVLHGPTAACALAREYPQIPTEVIHAIDVHTTACEDMSDLDMILYIADALEPNRQFGRIDELRAEIGRVTLEQLFFDTYEYWVFLLFERRRPLHPDTIRIWNAYTAKRQMRKER